MANDRAQTIEHGGQQAALEMACYWQVHGQICLPGDIPRFYQLRLLETHIEKLGPEQGQVFPHGQMLDIGKAG
jgi:hypothetical protein